MCILRTKEVWNVHVIGSFVSWIYNNHLKNINHGLRAQVQPMKRAYEQKYTFWRWEELSTLFFNIFIYGLYFMFYCVILFFTSACCECKRSTTYIEIPFVSAKTWWKSKTFYLGTKSWGERMQKVLFNFETYSS